MKSLKESINRSVDQKDFEIKVIKKYIKTNYIDIDTSKLDIRLEHRKWIVNYPGDVKLNTKIGFITNSMFEWNKVENFDISNSIVASLNGSPRKCKEFNCSNCNYLITLDGAPQECENFNCSYCKHLTTIKGLSKSITNINMVGCPQLRK